MEITELRQMSNANPWKEMERTVRTVDEEKVKDCTEDVDALLVFVRVVHTTRRTLITNEMGYSRLVYTLQC